VATITVRNLDDEVQRRLKRRAVGNQRSMEAEARAILSAAVAEGEFVEAWLIATRALRGEEIPLPRRTRPRPARLE
jgi:plasmid stability protein